MADVYTKVFQAVAISCRTRHPKEKSSSPLSLSLHLSKVKKSRSTKQMRVPSIKGADTDAKYSHPRMFHGHQSSTSPPNPFYPAALLAIPIQPTPSPKTRHQKSHTPPRHKHVGLSSNPAVIHIRRNPLPHLFPPQLACLCRAPVTHHPLQLLLALGIRTPGE